MDSRRCSDQPPSYSSEFPKIFTATQMSRRNTQDYQAVRQPEGLDIPLRRQRAWNTVATAIITLMYVGFMATILTLTCLDRFRRHERSNITTFLHEGWKIFCASAFPTMWLQIVFPQRPRRFPVYAWLLMFGGVSFATAIFHIVQDAIRKDTPSSRTIGTVHQQ